MAMDAGNNMKRCKVMKGRKRRHHKKTIHESEKLETRGPAKLHVPPTLLQVRCFSELRSLVKRRQKTTSFVQPSTHPTHCGSAFQQYWGECLVAQLHDRGVAPPPPAPAKTCAVRRASVGFGGITPTEVVVGL
jgi:hypothetical protein